jgi:hypothetical protein
MNDETILRALVIVLFIPAVGAVVAYLAGHPSRALRSPSVLPAAPGRAKGLRYQKAAVILKRALIALCFCT